MRYRDHLQHPLTGSHPPTARPQRPCLLPARPKKPRILPTVTEKPLPTVTEKPLLSPARPERPRLLAGLERPLVQRPW